MPSDYCAVWSNIGSRVGTGTYESNAHHRCLASCSAAAGGTFLAILRPL